MSLVAGYHMERSIADFQRACETHLAEEQCRANPDNALIALLCDAVRCSRELAFLGVSVQMVDARVRQEREALARAMKQLLPPALLAEVLAHLDPLTPFVAFLRAQP